jgi:hypothetical protein
MFFVVAANNNFGINSMANITTTLFARLTSTKKYTCDHLTSKIEHIFLDYVWGNQQNRYQQQGKKSYICLDWWQYDHTSHLLANGVTTATMAS